MEEADTVFRVLPFKVEMYVVKYATPRQRSNDPLVHVESSSGRISLWTRSLVPHRSQPHGPSLHY